MSSPRFFALLLFWGFTFSYLNGQISSRLPDSLQIPTNPDSLYFSQLQKFGNTQLFNDPPLAMAAYRRMGNLAREVGDPVYQAKSFSSIAVAHIVTNVTDSALRYLDSTMYYSILIADSEEIYRVELHRGICFFNIGHYERAMRANRKALAYYQRTENEVAVAKLANNIGLLYEQQKDFPSATDHYREALRAGKATENASLVSAALNNLGSVFLIRKQLDSAEVYIERSYANDKEEGNLQHHAGLCAMLGQLRTKQKRWEEAEAAFEEGMELARQMEDPGAMSILFQNRGEWFEAMGRPRLALADFDSAAVYSTLSFSPEGEMSAAESRYKLLKKMGRFEAALTAYELTKLMQDSLFGLEKTRHLEELSALHQSERKQQEIMRLESERTLQDRLLDQQTWLIAGLGIAFLSTLVLLGYAIVAARRRRRDNLLLQAQNERIDQQQQEIVLQNKRLAQQNQHLETLNGEMEGLIEIVAHDLKSPISKVQALLDLAGEDGATSDNYLPMAQHILGGGMNLIQDILFLRRIESKEETLDLAKIELNAFLKDLHHSFRPKAEEKQIELLLEEMSAPVSINTSPGDLERILDNLLSNALKFSPAQTQVFLSLQTEEQGIELSIRDQGPGISPTDQKRMFQKFQRLSAQPTAGESSSGLGLSIVKALVNRLGGQITVESELGKGSNFIVRLPFQTS